MSAIVRAELERSEFPLFVIIYASHTNKVFVKSLEKRRKWLNFFPELLN